MIDLILSFLGKKRRNHRMMSKPIPKDLPANLKIGLAGENAATSLYIKQGFEILERNYRQGKAEIDIIAKNRKYFVFCEVKSHVGSPDEPSPFGRPAAAVDTEKKQHMAAVASYFAKRYGKSERRFRFDVVEVYLSADLKPIFINQIKNAFTKNG